MSSEFITLTSIYFLALLSPGQDFFLIIKHALSHGYQKAWWSCLGIASGNALYIALAYIGHSLLSHYAFVITWIELGGALFLLYLGILLLKAPRAQYTTTSVTHALFRFKLFYLGLFSALLNPKNILFYFSLLFTIISPSTELSLKCFYALWMVFMLLVWDMSVAWLFGNQKALGYIRYLYPIQKGVGVALIAFSIQLLVNWVSAKSI